MKIMIFIFNLILNLLSNPLQKMKKCILFLEHFYVWNHEKLDEIIWDKKVVTQNSWNIFVKNEIWKKTTNQRPAFAWLSFDWEWLSKSWEIILATFGTAEQFSVKSDFTSEFLVADLPIISCFKDKIQPF